MPPPNPGAMSQGNPTTLVSGAVDGYNSNEDASVLQRPTQGSSTTSSCLLNNERESSYLAEYVREAKNLAKGTTVRFGSWNVGSLTGKLREVVDTAARSGVNILCVQETRWGRLDEVEVEDTGFRIWNRGGEKPNGVGILVDKSLKNRIFGVTRKTGIILVKLIVSHMVLNVISASAAQVYVSEDAKQKFWEDLNGLVRGVPSSERLIIGGDFHGHVGRSREGFHRVHGGFGYGDKNQEGEEILNFALANDLMVANTFFKKKESHIVTFINGEYSSQINFFLARRGDRKECKECKVIPEGCVVSQHQLLVSDFVFGAKTTWTKWWKLAEDAPRVFKDKTKAEGVTKIKDRTVAGVTKIKYRTMTEGVTKTRRKKNGRSMKDRRGNQPWKAGGDWRQKVAVESLGVTTKWTRK
ncbi:craniofacial development protein 2-like isoform X1 [Papaver somniferum]|uniref:craniofacial development protein 2-like isoform X1 n=1 Tax=Papaver somniferum TaxID=3469 RepID=UPI000E7014E6|nr:craniofacial development protein 2-like isoform X1 [Papaver somniferum]